VSTAAYPAAARAGHQTRAAARLPGWWPLAALTLLAAVLRLSTLDLQSFWYDEAFTPVHVLHASLGATLRSVVHTENSPPLWYLLEWADSRVLGTGAVALRLPSALAGIATVPVAWAIGRELSGRRAAIICAALVAVNPLFVWYSQEARVYGLFVFASALAMLCFLRALRAPTPRRIAAFALTGALALATHYFAVFLLAPMVLWLAWDRRTRRAALPAIGALAIVGLALTPLISAQGGHGTQWIGRWPLSERLQAIPQYYLTGYTGSSLGHGIELLVALPILAGLTLGLWRMTGPAPSAMAADSRRVDAPATPTASRAAPGAKAGVGDQGHPTPPSRGLTIALTIAACGVLIPIVLVAFGADYLAPRNLVAAMIPVTVVIALLVAWPAGGAQSTGALAATIVVASAIVVAFLAISIDIELSPRLQRGNWRDLAAALRSAPSERVITTVELGTAPLEYYLPGSRGVHSGGVVRVREIDETGYKPLVASAGEPPVPGFHLLARVDVDGLIAYRFVSPVARRVSEAALRRHVITLASPAVLGPASVQVSS
jgi:uncharacterized membrane protein